MQIRNGQERRRAGAAVVDRASIETLESRRLLAVVGQTTPLLAGYAGDQPQGSLTGYTVYTSGGHGYASNGTVWRTGRGINNGMVEDIGNQDQLAFYVDYLWHAGATVVPLRPVGNQPNEVVVDQSSSAVTYSGSWSNSTAPVYYGNATDLVSYRFASAAATETATATYRPTIPKAGVYPVYTWVADSANRSNQLYRVNHAGGSSEVRVDHRNVG